MNEREFLDLLRYYFRKVKPEDVEEILSDYKAHFTEARERGLSDEQIAAELGHPEDIYASYQSEGIVSEKTKMEKFLTMQNTWPTKHSKRCSRHGMKSALTFRTLPVQQHLSLPSVFTLCTVLSIFLFAATLLTIIYYLCILLPLWMRIPYRDSTR